MDLVTASGSGLDPEISPAAAELPGARASRGSAAWTRAEVRALVRAPHGARQWGILGEPRVNVLELNLALDALH